MYYGFDMGGTKIEMGVFDSSLNRLWTKRIATPKHDYLALLQIFTDLVKEADQIFSCEGHIGIGIPGLIERDKGIIFATNVPCAKEKPLVNDLQHRLQRPVLVENDANCFALSEALDVEFQQYPSVLGMILGTGLGGGLVINGKIFSGYNSTTGEIGHLRLTVDLLKIVGFDIPLLKCGCGQYGCVENYLSGRGFEWLYQYYYHESFSARQIIENYYEGNKKAIEHIDRFLRLMSAYLGNILTIIDPHLLVIGGGLSNFDLLYSELAKQIPAYLFEVAKVPRIEKARYGDAGGVRGAAFLNLAN